MKSVYFRHNRMVGKAVDNGWDDACTFNDFEIRSYIKAIKKLFEFLIYIYKYFKTAKYNVSVCLSLFFPSFTPLNLKIARYSLYLL